MPTIITFIRKSYLYNFFIFCRYFIKRYFINRQFRNYHICKKEINLSAVCKEKISFFGYYNLSPVNKNGDIVFLSVNDEITRGSLYESAQILISDSAGNVKKIADSKSWNWQQGCMLQWMPNNEDLIIFNDYDIETDRYVSRVINKKGDPVNTYSIPINNVSKSGKYALSLNYDRLAKMRPDYGYFNRKNFKLPLDDKDGIRYLDLINGREKLIITLKQLIELCPTGTMDSAMHKVNHIDINPSCTRFMFLHRWIGPGGRYMRLITANPDGSDIYILNGDEMTSHCCWIDNNNILSYCYIEGKGKGYFRLQDKSDYSSIYSEKLPNVDGHPSFSPDRQWLITDTYPDISRMSTLFIYNVGKNEIYKLGYFHQPLRYRKEKRIDMHPKWTGINNKVIFESGHNNKRQLYILDFKNHLSAQ